MPKIDAGKYDIYPDGFVTHAEFKTAFADELRTQAEENGRINYDKLARYYSNLCPAANSSAKSIEHFHGNKNRYGQTDGRLEGSELKKAFNRHENANSWLGPYNEAVYDMLADDLWSKAAHALIDMGAAIPYSVEPPSKYMSYEGQIRHAKFLHLRDNGMTIKQLNIGLNLRARSRV